MGLPSLRNKICLWVFFQQVLLFTEAEKSVYFDLSYSVNNDTIYYPGQRYGFEMYKDKYGFQESGNWYASFSYCLGEHTGTHVDAPIHFTENGLTLDEIPPSHLIDVPATVVDLEGLVFDLESPDGFTIEVEHFIKHETKHGQIPFQGVVLVHTGWSRFWPDKMKYLGYDNVTSDKPILRFPGCSEEAARWLVNERGIVAFGVDTPSPKGEALRHIPVCLGEMLPSHVGTPLGEEHRGSTYFMLELHYDNPELKTFTDSSGVRIYYTDKLREYDGAVLLMGYRITPFLLLPPKQDNFVTYGLCSRECTEKAIPEEGINIIISLVHAHLTGRKIRLRHFRNGKELPLIAEDNHYDFNFQQSKPLKNEVTILRGYELTVECEYSTKDNDRMVLGGFSTTEEMCQVFLMYYPRIDLMQCTSQVEYSDFFKALNVDEVSGSVLTKLKMPYKLPPPDQYFDAPDDAKEVEASGDADGASFNNFFDQINIKKPSHLKGETVGAYLRRGNWTRKSKEIESAWKNSKHYAFCTGHGRKRVPLQNHIISYPRITEPLKPPPSVCSMKDGYAYNEPRRNRNNLSTSAVSKILTTTQVHAFMSGWLLLMTRFMSL